MEPLQTINPEALDSQEDELKAQEKLNQRREARRRKILENAKNRLERLNGRTAATTTTTINTTSNINTTTVNTNSTTDSHDEHHSHEHFNGPTTNHLDSVEFSDPEVEPDIIPQQLLQNEPSMLIGDLFSSLNADTTTTSAPSQQKRHILLRARLHLIVSALIACILTFVFRESTTTTSAASLSIFIPAGLCVVIDLLFFREQQPLNPLISLAITMLNIRLPSQTQNVLHLFSIIQSLIVDLGVFVFSFCIFSCSLVCLNSNFIDLIVIK